MTTRTAESDRILADLQELRRGPFREALSECLGNRPTAEAWSALAEKSPDRWSQAIGTLARASGFRDQIEVDADVSIGRRVSEMSDMEMQARLAELRAESTPALPPPVEETPEMAERLAEPKTVEAPTVE